MSCVTEEEIEAQESKGFIQGRMVGRNVRETLLWV